MTKITPKYPPKFKMNASQREQAANTKPFTMISKYNSRCKGCGSSIAANIDEIGKNENDQWVCIDCVAGESSIKPATPVTASTLSAAIGISSSYTQSDENLVKQKVAGVGSLPKNYTPSPHQLAIYEFVENGTGNAVVEAVAGGGKTTTIIEALKLTDKNSRIAFVAFNKHIATELEMRSPDHINVSTLHSLGLRNLRKLGRVQIEQYKVAGILEKYYPTAKNAPIKSLERSINKVKSRAMQGLVSLVKATLTDENSPKELVNLVSYYSIDLEKYDDELLKLLPEIIKKCEEETSIIDFDDMIWLALRLDIPLEEFDMIFIDEAQDLNKSQAEFVKRSLSENGRIIAVGDRRQSLYGFRGADTKSIENLIKEFDAKTLPLSVTYRCPISHVELAKKIVPQITARKDAKQGGLYKDKNSIDVNAMIAKVTPGDMIICRTNAPLVAPAFELIRKGIKAVVRGKDIGSNLVNLVRRMKADSLATLDVSLGAYLNRQSAYLLSRDKQLAAVDLRDRVSTIRVVMEQVDTQGELISKIQNLFSDKNEGVVLSSIHKAKGLESDNVFILRPDLLPHPLAKQGWEKIQEENAEYVAITRSKENLYFVTGGSDED